MSNEFSVCLINKMLLPVCYFLILLAIFSYLTLIVSGVLDNGTTNSYFATRSEIPEDDGVNSWLPLFFPVEAEDINYFINVEAHFFYVSFDLEKNEGEKFRKELITKATTEGLGFIHAKYTKADRAWCKLDVIPEQGPEKHIFIIGKNKENDTYYMGSISDKRELSNTNLYESWAKYCASSILF